MLQAVDVHRAVDDDGGRFLTALRVDVDIPGETDVLDVRIVDLVEGAETLFVVVAAGEEPGARLAIGLEQALRVDGRGAQGVGGRSRLGLRRFTATGGHERCGSNAKRSQSGFHGNSLPDARSAWTGCFLVRKTKTSVPGRQ